MWRRDTSGAIIAGSEGEREVTSDERSASTISTDAGEAIPVFWTGGWDSTFRVLNLGVHEGCIVQPIYVVDQYRKSWRNELDAIERIRAATEKKFPERAANILELMLISKSDVQISETIRGQYSVLRSNFEISWQYEYLASVVENSEYDQVEVSLIAEDNLTLSDFVRKHAFENTYPCGATTWAMKDWDSSNAFDEGMKMFHHFTFPAIYSMKRDLDSQSKARGFDDILALTWFCHYPIGDQPCGACYVCRHVISSGLTERFPKSALMRNKVWFIVHPGRLLLANPERFIERIRDKISWKRSG